MQKNYTLFLLIFILSFLLSGSKPSSSIPKKRKATVLPLEFRNHSKEYYYDTVDQGLKAHNLTKGHPPYPFYKKMDYNADKKRRKEIIQNFLKKENLRKLSLSTQTLENLGFIGLTQTSTATSNKVMKFVTNNIKKDDSRFVLYPYPFEYKNPENEIKQVNEGGFFSMNQSALKGQSFEYIQNISSAQIGKAKGLYDIDIAILSMDYIRKGMEVDLFYEASDFCNYFANVIQKTSTCLAGKNAYQEYKQKFPSRGAVVRLSANDVLNDTLYDSTTQQLKFKLLIVPDYLLGNEETIFSENYLTSEAVNIIKTFRDLGGNIITSGKSGYLLELMGIIQSGTYDNNYLLQTTGEKGENTISGCELIYKNNPEEQPDYLKQLICLGYASKTVLSGTYKVKNIPNNFESLIKYTNTAKKLQYIQNNSPFGIEDPNETFEYILVSNEEEGKGRIFLVNGNPIGNPDYFQNVRNMILYSMTKNFIYDLKIKFAAREGEENDEDLPIPAGEEGVQLQVDYKFYNLYDKLMTNFNLEILLVNKVKIVQYPPNCQFKEEIITKFDELKLDEFNKSQYLLCQAASIEQLHSIGSQFKIEITNYTVTQKLVDIPLLFSSLSFEMENELIQLNPGIFYAQAAIAALLRGTLNKHPSSAYPMLGRGLYFDLVLTVENKENTLAKDVNYIAMVPLVTPLVDGEDEGKVAQVIPPYEDYYFRHNFSYPWVDIDNRSRDYVDYAEVAGKNVCYVNDYDTPVKLSKNQRSDEKVDYPNKFNMTKNENITLDEQQGPSKGISPYTLLRQLNFVDAERFYETAAPRQTLFINPATEIGAREYFKGGDIPLEEQDIEDPTKGRVHLAFIRVDTFFYTSIFNQYQLPKGLDGTVLLSIDKFEQGNTKEDKTLGAIRAKIRTPGHYDWTKGRLNTLQPNQYTNPMRQYKNIKQYDPTNPADLKTLQEMTNDNDTIKLTHFMMPNKISLIHRAGNIYGFAEDDSDGNGHLIEYPSVKFVYAHSIELILAPEITRLGGYVDIILDEGVDFSIDDPVEEDKITTSADNVAFFKNEYIRDTHTVRLYFRRGLMPNENYGLPSKCEAYLENLNKKENFTVTIKIYELKYDFSSETLESYYLIENATKEIEAVYKSFFSYPCVYLNNKVSRKSSFSDKESRDMFEYELMNPFARYGGYFQELTKHTTVYGSVEAHHRTDPGFQGITGGFSIISNIGTSSIPFAEFLNHATLAIPGVTSTSRLEWHDIWGRMWAQNLRSVYPDIPPIPPSPLNFIMTTTFELITDTKNPEDQTRVIEWQSDESVYIRIQMKMRNTYKLYWEPTLCLNNQRPFIKESTGDNRNPIFIEEDTQTVDSTIGDNYDVNLGVNSVYGVCYDNRSYMNGTKVTDRIVEGIKYMITCAQTLDPEELTNCSRVSVEQGYPIVKRRPDTINDTLDPTPDDNWNYSPLIENYLPDGYINSNQMWQLTIEDYSDDQFWKGYPWHLDDCIPNLDNYIIKPHDIIAFPIYKGIGYNMTYSRDYSLYKFPEYKGWWSDQLQNKDHTLLAGQQKVSQVSVGHPSLLKDSDWINGFDLQNPKYNVKNRMKNFYVCMFNRHRVKVTPGQKKFAFLGNVYINNVVPILPDLQENDPRYKNYDCLKETPYQYSIYNISQVDNRVYTGNDRDWLYFAAGLRGNAMEDINVIMKLDPIEATKFEGITKVQDGGRFVYWQPPDGPNSYQYYDGNVNTVISKRVDLTILGKALPSTINTFNTYLYEIFDINDEKELNRTYTMDTYMNSHGYGDATTAVYVGGVDATSCRVEPGTHTIVKIVFYNNAGFDWEMKEGAITLNESAYGPIFLNAMNIMKGKLTAIQYPSEYKFMKYEIPDEIKKYVTLTPSQHVMDVSPQFFDLTFNNILTIKDALEGDYFYCLNVSEEFPDNLKGKLWEIKMTLDESWFNTLPSLNDPTGIHDYHLTIPSIRFGVPISEGENKGKIFYNLGQARNMVYTYKLYNEFEIKGIKLVNEDIINQLGQASGNRIEKYSKLKEIWDNIPTDESIINKIQITSEIDNKDPFYNLHTINLKEAFPLLPYEIASNKPYQNRIYLLIQSYSDHSPFGHRDLMIGTSLNYTDGRKNKTAKSSPSRINIYSEGPNFVPSFEHKIAELNESTMKYEVSRNQEIYNGDSLVIQLTLIAENEGTAPAYNPQFNLYIEKDAEYMNLNQTSSALVITEGEIIGDSKLINIFYKSNIAAQQTLEFKLYFKIQFGQRRDEQININGEENQRRRILADSNNDQFKLVKEFNISLCLTENLCQEGDPNYGKQKTDLQHSISYKKNIVRDVGKISLNAENIGNETYPKYNLTATISDIQESYQSKDIEYLFYRKIEGIDDDYKLIKRSSLPNYIDEPFAEYNMAEIKNYKVTYKVIGQFDDGRTLDSLADRANFYEDIYEYKEKEEKEKKGFPAYAIAIICVLGLALIAGTAFFAYKLLAKKSAETIAITASENPAVIKYDGDKTSTASPRVKKRRIQNRSVISMENNNQ